MKRMRIPIRPAPTLEEARQKATDNKSKSKASQPQEKKKPPPRPPPPNFNKSKSKSAWTLNQAENTISLIEWSPPSSPKPSNHHYGGSVSSSFSSSTSSLASSKKSLDYDSVPFNNNPWNTTTPFPFPTYGLQATNIQQHQQQKQNVAKVVPTIIRPPPKKTNARRNNYSVSRDVSPLLLSYDESPRDNYTCLDLASGSPPMPSMPPPSPPKIVEEKLEPFGIALFDYPASHADDLQLQVNDIVYLLKKVNKEWLYGRVDDREGMFPANFVEVQVPLPEEDVSMAIYDFVPEVAQDLPLRSGQAVKILGRISNEWLLGESEGRQGQFPANFVDRVPPNI